MQKGWSRAAERTGPGVKKKKPHGRGKTCKNGGKSGHAQCDIENSLRHFGTKVLGVGAGMGGGGGRSLGSQGKDKGKKGGGDDGSEAQGKKGLGQGGGRGGNQWSETHNRLKRKGGKPGKQGIWLDERLWVGRVKSKYSPWPQWSEKKESLKGIAETDSSVCGV